MPQQADTTVEFPLGIADGAGQFAYICDSTGALIALDLDRGSIKWKLGPPARPLLIMGDELAVLRPEDSHGFQIAILDPTREGAERRRFASIVLPEWVRVGLHNGPEFALSAERTGPRLIVKWEAHARYEGGAAPSKRIMRAAERDLYGTVTIDVDSGHLEKSENEQPLEIAARMEKEGESALLPPGVLSQTVIGGRTYQLATRAAAGVAQSIVRALDASGKQLWETVIEQRAHGRPTPPRP